MSGTNTGERVWYVTVTKKEEITYQVTSADGVSDETEAQVFVETADIETVDAREIHAETVSTDVTAVEEVDQ